MTQPDAASFDSAAAALGYDSHEHFLSARSDAQEQTAQDGESFSIEMELIRQDEEQGLDNQPA
jgi:hypothetical protein